MFFIILISVGETQGFLFLGGPSLNVGNMEAGFEIRRNTNQNKDWRIILPQLVCKVIQGCGAICQTDTKPTYPFLGAGYTRGSA